MLNIFAIFIGGGLGSVLRYLANITVGSACKDSFCSAFASTFATLSVNILGSFLIGFLYSIFIQKTGMPPALKLAVTVGFCGGLTTFSTFSIESYDLLKNGEIFSALGYILLSVVVCIIMSALGIYMGTVSGAYFAK